MNRLKIFFAIALTCLVLAVVILYIKYQAVTLNTPLPNPNGYDQFVKAAAMLQGDASGFGTLNEADLTALIATNAGALALAHSAFSNECRVPILDANVYSRNQTFVQTGIQDLAAFMAAKGRLAELENHPAEAAKDYLEVMRFGMDAGRGGFMLDAIMGIKVEGLARFPLERLLHQLDASSCHATAITLETLDSSRQDFDDVFYRELTFHRQVFPNFRSFFPYLRSSFPSVKSWIGEFAAMRKRNTEMRKATGDQFRDRQFETRILAVKFAARAYELDRGQPPSNIHDLVPAYLKSVPHDPDTGENMVYPPR